MQIQSLNNTPFEVIYNCFYKAFANYYVQMPNDINYYKERWTMSKIDFAHSYGMFDKNLLIGFILNAIEYRNNHLTAFNLATGVLPEFRGQKITKTIYEYALPILRKKGITKCQLEVITLNASAIKAYQSVGFSISKYYKCFNGIIIPKNGNYFEINKFESSTIDFEILPNQDLYSWENQKETILRGSYDFYQIANNEVIESYFIINPANNYITQLGVFNDKPEVWQGLFTTVKSISEQVKINNVDSRLKTKIEAILGAGIKNTIDQYEMELFLT